ncbi:hypothetical protein G6011_08871 [Alternaria panax]|uniref:EthD domain-containing protein n=1 Tax=Alternaria panax TaxID=48097 RepID=A0AAD4IA18_9PLEO|nr:hypothetical protein G6011_08871 [Alternaria panax]
MPSSLPTTDAGVFLAFLKPTSIGRDEALEDEKFALLPTAMTANVLGIKTVAQYRAANAEYEKRHLVICETEDLARVNGKQMLKFLGGEDMGGEWDVRAYREVEIFDLEKSDEAAKTIMVALMQPSPTGAADLDAWYREEHNQQMSEQPGWLRTCRYSFISQQSSSPGGGGGSQELSFLAIHEFGEGEQLGDAVKALDPISEWTAKVMNDAVGIDAAIYRRV